MARLKCSDHCMIYVLFGFNLIIVVISAILMTLAAAFVFKWSVITDFLELGPILEIIPPTVQKWIPWVVLGVSGLMLIISFLGCSGAIAENDCMVLMYSVALIAFVILEVIFVVLIYTQRHIIYDKVEEYSNMIRKATEEYTDSIQNDDIKAIIAKFGGIPDLDSETIPKNYTDTIKKFRNTLDHNQLDKLNTFQMLQAKFECCGIHGANDFAVKDVIIFLPKSCCPDSAGRCDKHYAYKGCWTKIEDSKGIIIAVGVVFICVEMITAIVGLFLVNSLKNMKND